MKVLHINSDDLGGGAAIAAYRHHEAMLLNGIDSKILVLNKKTNLNGVYKITQNKLSNFITRLFNKVFNIKYDFFGAWSWNHFGHDVSNSKLVKDADVIIFHWINKNTLSLKSIRKILETGKPIYWFMHDMWPITGGCHHAFDCEKYKYYCYQCPMMHQRNGSKCIKDISYYQFKEKLQVLDTYSNLKFITPSKWLFNKVKESRIGKNHNVFLARNVLNTEYFKPRDKRISRSKLGLKQDKKLILFGADYISSPYKGWIYLKNALNDLGEDIECVVYGSSNSSDFEDIKVNIHNIGKINDTEKLIDLYSACDVFVSPSLADNYPNVLLESMACGLVCVGFKTGGIPEIIENNYNGIIVDNYDSKDLRDAIIAVITNKDYDTLSSNAVKSIKTNNNYSNIIHLDK